jgi:hypothetical protein
VAGFALYASVEIFVKAAQGDLPATLEIILPQAAATVLAAALVLRIDIRRNLEPPFARDWLSVHVKRSFFTLSSWAGGTL